MVCLFSVQDAWKSHSSAEFWKYSSIRCAKRVFNSNDFRCTSKELSVFTEFAIHACMRFLGKKVRTSAFRQAAFLQSVKEFCRRGWFRLPTEAATVRQAVDVLNVFNSPLAANHPNFVRSFSLTSRFSCPKRNFMAIHTRAASLLFHSPTFLSSFRRFISPNSVSFSLLGWYCYSASIKTSLPAFSLGCN